MRTVMSREELTPVAPHLKAPEHVRDVFERVPKAAYFHEDAQGPVGHAHGLEESIPAAPENPPESRQSMCAVLVPVYGNACWWSLCGLLLIPGVLLMVSSWSPRCLLVVVVVHPKALL